jgi:BirA family biotin operon repressor/biotin-[acetyl-CoA-carboxylase] ligase
MFSIVLKNPKISARDQFCINEITSLSVVDFLSQHGISARIKWPNDIYVGSKKICGILIENSLRGSDISSSIIGIGLNINQRNFDVNLPNPTSMALCQPESTYEIHQCLEEFMDIFRSYVSRLMDYGTGGSLRESYLSKLWRLNEQAIFIDYTSLPSGCHEGPMNISASCSPGFPGQTAPAGRPFTGIIRGLSPIGLLIVEEMEKGELKEFAFKEIGYIL